MSQGRFDRTIWESLLRQIVRRTKNSSDAEDLLHSAFLRLEKYRASHTVENPSAFLVQTAINIRVDDYRRKRRLGQLLSDKSARTDNNQPLQDEVMCARARLERVKAGLDRLPERTREILLMHRLDGLKLREIADRLGISQSAVEKHLARAVLFLADWTDGW